MNTFYILLLIILGDHGVSETTQVEQHFASQQDCVEAGKRWKKDLAEVKVSLDGVQAVFSCIKIKEPK